MGDFTPPDDLRTPLISKENAELTQVKLVNYSIEEDNDKITVIIRSPLKTRIVCGCLLCVSFAFFGFFCCFTITTTQKLNDPGLFLGMIALACVLFLAHAAWAIILFRERDKIVVRNDTFQFYRSAIIRFEAREYPLSEVFRIRESKTSIKGKWPRSESIRHEVEVVTLGMPLTFGQQWSREERRWFILKLNEFIERRRTGPSSRGRIIDNIEDPCISEVLEERDVVPYRPIDCRIRDVQDALAIFFIKSEPLDKGAAFACVAYIFILISNARSMWNSNPLQLKPVWLLLLASIFYVSWVFPFWVIFKLLVNSLWAIGRSLIVTTWRAENSDIIERNQILLFSRQRKCEVQNLACLEVRRMQCDIKKILFFYEEVGRFHSGPHFRLVFIGANDTDLFTMQGLTEGEARWIGGMILKRRPQWFIENGS